MVTEDKQRSVIFFVEDGEPLARIAGEDSFSQNMKFLCAFAFAGIARRRAVRIGRVSDLLYVQSQNRPNIAYLLPNEGTRLFLDTVEVAAIEIYAEGRNTFTDAKAVLTTEEVPFLKKEAPAGADGQGARSGGSKKKKRVRTERPPIRELKLFGNPHVPMASVGETPFKFQTVFDESVEEGEQEISVGGQLVAYATRVPNRPKTFEIRPHEGIRLIDVDGREWPFLLLIFRSAGAQRLAADGVQGSSQSVLKDDC